MYVVNGALARAVLQAFSLSIKVLVRLAKSTRGELDLIIIRRSSHAERDEHDEVSPDAIVLVDEIVVVFDVLDAGVSRVPQTVEATAERAPSGLTSISPIPISSTGGMIPSLTFWSSSMGMPPFSRPMARRVIFSF